MVSQLRPLAAGAALVLLGLLPAACAHRGSAPGFTLTDQNGSAWSLDAQHGKAVVLTFGFTHCQDTCPATLAKISRATAKLGERVEIAFVTVDPQRDSPAALRAFLARFGDGRIVGLTGPFERVDAVLRDYHVWAQRIPGRGRTAPYDVAHAAVIYFIDPSGNVRSLHDDDDPPATIAAAAAALLG